MLDARRWLVWVSGEMTEAPRPPPGEIEKICLKAGYYAARVIDTSLPEEVREQEWARYLELRQDAFEALDRLAEPAARSRALGNIVRMLTVARETGAASEAVARISAGKLRDEAAAVLVEGPVAALKALASGTPPPRAADPAENRRPPSAKRRAPSRAVPLGRLSWTIGVYGAAAVIFAATAFIVMESVSTRSPGPPAQEEARATAPSVATPVDASGLESRLLGRSETLRAIRDHFPDDYRVFAADALQRAGRGEDDDAILAIGRAFASELRVRERASFRAASFATLQKSLELKVPMFTYLRNVNGPQACNVFSIGGDGAIEDIISEAREKGAELAVLADRAAAQYFAAAAEGRTRKMVHAAPTDADWQEAAQFVIQNGMTRDEILLFADARQRASDPRLCDATVKWLNGLLEMKGGAAERLVPYLAAGMAGA
jgi:hypothetical protein